MFKIRTENKSYVEPPLCGPGILKQIQDSNYKVETMSKKDFEIILKEMKKNIKK